MGCCSDKKNVIIIGDKKEESKELLKKVEEYIKENNIDANLAVITDEELENEDEEIRTPGLIINNIVYFLGLNPSKEELKEYFEDEGDDCECGDCDGECNHEHEGCHGGCNHE